MTAAPSQSIRSRSNIKGLEFPEFSSELKIELKIIETVLSNSSKSRFIRIEQIDREDFEKMSFKGYWTDKSYDGFHYIKDYKVFTENTCRFSRRYLKYTYELYRKYDEDLYRKVITSLWAHAVNDILDLWLTILWNGFGERDYKAYGLPKPVGIRDVEKINYEKIRELE